MSYVFFRLFFMILDINVVDLQRILYKICTGLYEKDYLRYAYGTGPDGAGSA